MYQEEVGSNQYKKIKIQELEPRTQRELKQASQKNLI